MSVNPGVGGQKLVTCSLDKISALRQLIMENNLSCLIEVDGGVNSQNVKEIIKAGADILVAGSAVFGQKDRK